MKYIVVLVFTIIFGCTKASTQNLQYYAFKSGMIKYKIEGRVNGIELIYFDDYGNLFYDLKTLNNSSGENDSQCSNINILCYDTIIALDINKHTATRNLITDTLSKIKRNIASPEMLNDLAYSRSGAENVSGVLCDKYSGENGKMWVWNNIVIKSEIIIMDIIVKIEAIEVVTGIEIPKSKFEIPKNYILINN